MALRSETNWGVDKGSHNNKANNSRSAQLLHLPSVEALAQYMHTTEGSPLKSTWLRVIKKETFRHGQDWRTPMQQSIFHMQWRQSKGVWFNPCKECDPPRYWLCSAGAKLSQGRKVRVERTAALTPLDDGASSCGEFDFHLFLCPSRKQRLCWLWLRRPGLCYVPSCAVAAACNDSDGGEWFWPSLTSWVSQCVGTWCVAAPFHPPVCWWRQRQWPFWLSDSGCSSSSLSKPGSLCYSWFDAAPAATLCVRSAEQRRQWMLLSVPWRERWWIPLQ